MNQAHAFQAYKKIHVETAKPEKILLLLYEGCLKFVRAAKVKMAEKKTVEKGKSISQAIAILAELTATLDHKVAGELAAELENLYVFMTDRLIEANLHNRIEDLLAVEKILLTLYEAWVVVVNKPSLATER